MKRLFSIVPACFCACAASGVTVTVDKVQQRYPWNGMVDVDYTIAYDDGEPALDPLLERLAAQAVDTSASPAVTNDMNNLSPAPLDVTAGTHRMTWDANADGVTNVSDAVSVRIEVRRYASKYLLVDLREGSTASSYPVTYLAAEPTGGFNVGDYKGDFMVFRLVPPGSFMMGSPSTEGGRNANETQHRVVISKPMYVGLFEVTQKQYKKVMGSVPSERTGELRPVGYLFGADIRCNYPTSATNAIDSGSFVGKFRTRTGLAFDLPTEAQWEYACRGGTATAFNDGIAQAAGSSSGYDASMAALGRYSGNNTEGAYNGGPTTVGSFAPNGWGLYDMHGNVSEYCRDYRYEYSTASAEAVDPIGRGQGSFVVRGGSYGSTASDCRSAMRGTHMGSQNRNNFATLGFRLVLTLD